MPVEIERGVSQTYLKELVDLLLNSCTDYSEDVLGGHEHNLFDSMDRDKLRELRDKLAG